MSPGCVTEGAGPAARWHCPRIVPCRSGSSSPGRSAEPSPGAERGVPGGALPGQKGQRTRVPSSQPVTSGLGAEDLTEGRAWLGLFLASHPVGAQGKQSILCILCRWLFLPADGGDRGLPGAAAALPGSSRRESLCSCRSSEEPQSPAPCSWLNCTPLAWSG